VKAEQILRKMVAPPTALVNCLKSVCERNGVKCAADGYIGGVLLGKNAGNSLAPYVERIVKSVNLYGFEQETDLAQRSCRVATSLVMPILKA
jgi:hypothetical protein